ncbi:MAG: extracellular solute-binding protein [Clostridiales bacterium]|nr:extracellular solute-binding protein [Clostridiales bacterium]
MKRLFAGSMAILIMFAVLISGCGSKTLRERVTINSSDTWYKSKKIVYCDKCSADDYEYFYFRDPVSLDGSLLVTYNAYNSNGAAHDPICLFDEDGNLIREFELNDEISLARLLNTGIDNGEPVLFYASDGKFCEAVLDVTTGEITGTDEFDLGGESDKIVDCTTCMGYIFALGTKQDKDTLYVFKDGSLIAKNEMFAPYDMLTRVKPDENGFSIQSENMMYLFDPDTGELKKDGVATMEDYIDGFGCEVIGSDGRTYVKKEDGIYVDDQPYVMFTDTDCNVTDFLDASLIEVTDERIVLSIYPSSYLFDRHGGEDIIILDKQNENPNAGKTVISAKSYGLSIDHMTGEAIKRFNDENKDYFIRYSLKTIEDESEYEEYEKEFQEELISSEAADIYFSIDDLWWFQSDDYFVDLSKELDLDESTYYTKLINSASRDGKLYCMPVSFTATGLMTSGSNVKEGARGFTYEEYEQFVSTVGNGTDAVSESFGREDYFFMCFSQMNDTWFKDGKIDIANESFESMCGFFENVKEEPLYNEEDFMYGGWLETNKAYSYMMITPTFYSFLFGRYEDPTFLGLPSSDGRGPAAQIETSVSVSAVSDLKDGCVDFIKLLISQDIQESASYNPINRKALPAVLDREAEICTIEYEEAGFANETEAAQFDYYLPTDEIKYAYIESMEKVEVVSSLDPSIQTVVYEELSACFSGKKDVKEVEKTLQDRLTTLFNEKQNN